jgi:hypothetical protein
MQEQLERTAREKIDVSREGCLKASWEIVREEREPISARLAEQLGVNPQGMRVALGGSRGIL